MIDDGLLEFATAREREIIEAVNELGGFRKAERKLGLASGSASKAKTRLEKRAALRGYSPRHDFKHSLPETHFAKGVSTYYDSEGNVRGQWVKSSAKRQAMVEVAEEIVSALSLEAQRPKRKGSAPKRVDSDLLTIYPIADHHIGLYAWEAETLGADYDCDVARDLLTETMGSLVDRSPSSESALIANLGDFFHCDNQKNQTEASGHILDVDSRWARVTRLGCSLLVSCVELALAKHATVRVINETGNHDAKLSLVLSLYLDAYYRDEPRVEVDLSPANVHYHRFGANLIGTHHGDKIKPKELPGVMAVDRREDWAEVEFCHWLTGHIHHQSASDFNGAFVESFRTLQPGDAWAANAGYRSERSLVSITKHRTDGEVGRSQENVPRRRKVAK